MSFLKRAFELSCPTFLRRSSPQDFPPKVVLLFSFFPPLHTCPFPHGGTASPPPPFWLTILVLKSLFPFSFDPPPHLQVPQSVVFLKRPFPPKSKDDFPDAPFQLCCFSGHFPEVLTHSLSWCRARDPRNWCWKVQNPKPQQPPPFGNVPGTPTNDPPRFQKAEVSPQPRFGEEPSTPPPRPARGLRSSGWLGCTR